MNIVQAVVKVYQDVKQAFNPYMWTDQALIEKSYGTSIGAYPLDPSRYRGNEDHNDGFMPMPNTTYTYAGLSSAIEAYRRCPPITAIINKKAQAYINGKTWVLNSRNKEATGLVADRIKKLLQKPNVIQSWKQFEAQQKIYEQMFGYSVVLAIKPFGIKDNAFASALWNIPPHLLNIRESTKLFYQTDLKGIIDSVSLRYQGGVVDLNLDDLYFFKDFSPSITSMILPESRILSIAMPINNIIGAYESRNVLINRRGPMGAWTSEKSDASGNVPLTPKEKDEIQLDFKKYGLRFNQYKDIITSAAIKWQATGYPTKDLMLFEEIEGSTMAICDSYGYPYRLMGAEKSASYNDVKEFKKLLYQDTIIPEGQSMYEQWNEFFKLSDYNLRLDKDYSHLPVLQADAVQMATARKSRNEALEREYRYDMITMNRWLELNNEDTVPGGDIKFSEWLKAGNTDPYARNSGSAAPMQDGVNPVNTQPNAN